MSQNGETFFTTIGCMDGRVQVPVSKFGRDQFDANFPDTITEAGLVGKLANEPISNELIESIRFKLVDVSIGKHSSKGIVVHGHQECAGNPVSENQHISDIVKTCKKIKSMVKNVSVVGVFVYRTKNGWDTRVV